MSREFSYRQYRVVSYLGQAATQRLVDSVLDGTIEPETVFRDNWRTLSACVRFEGERFLLKVPRARNGRCWERQLTRIRGSDALRTFRHLELMTSLGLSAPEPILACECWVKGVVTDSFVCYRFVDGRLATACDAPQIIAALETLHRKGYLRNDAQIANFIVADGDITFIDFRLKKTRFLPALQKARELDRFLRSCPGAREALGPELSRSKWLKLAGWVEEVRFGFRNLKRRLRRR